MPTKLFVPQAQLDRWIAADSVDVAGEVLTDRATGLSMSLGPASFFVRVSAGTDEVYGLLGRVKAEEVIAELGGETYMTSVILGETAYEVEPGFVGLPLGQARAVDLIQALHAAG